jgi:hypothetical protein
MKWEVSENIKRVHRCASGECGEQACERIRRESMDKEAEHAHTTRTHDALMPSCNTFAYIIIHICY